ncbi:CSLREA domain-containing protein [Chloroflexus sp.]|uniref:CSLREA domain-containing protein n=1 Tax=Chloroflexus sp. TaxID=1904827 RepID=UPI002ACD8657|nr:CSLREA domain-containing protein [Chloroflexus sp.]
MVNALADTIANDSACTLREAILAANNIPVNANCGAESASNDTITFSVSGTITLGAPLPAIVAGQGTLTIAGGGNITISGNNAVQVMIVDSGADLTLHNLTIANGKIASGNGGGVANSGSLTVNSVTFSNNSASIGGGIINNGILTISNSTFGE